MPTVRGRCSALSIRGRGCTGLTTGVRATGRLATGGRATGRGSTPTRARAAPTRRRPSEERHVRVVAGRRVDRRRRWRGTVNALYPGEVVVYQVRRERRVPEGLGRLLTLTGEELDELAENCTLRFGHLPLLGHKVAVRRDRIGVPVRVGEDAGEELLEVGLELGLQESFGVAESGRL